MRLMKMFGLAALASVAAMAFVGASSASAEVLGVLCYKHEQPCTEVVEHETLHLSSALGILNGSNPNTDVLCLNVLALALQLTTGALDIDAQLTFTNCGGVGSGSHSNCTITETEESLIDLLWVTLNLGILKGLKGGILVKCVIFGFIKFECEYAIAGLEFHIEGAAGASNGVINMAGTFLVKTTGGSLCPEISEIQEGELEPLKPVYVVKKP